MKSLSYWLCVSVAVVATVWTHVHAQIVGIDVGSEYFKVAMVRPGAPFEVITNLQSKRKTPNALAFYKGERKFGTDAVQLATRRPHLVLYAPTELVGRNASNEATQGVQAMFTPGLELYQSDAGTMSFKLGNMDDAGELPSATYSAAEVSAMLLGHVQQFASVFAEKPVREAVLTVPAYATQPDRLAMRQAAEMAGLRVTGLVEEMTAAAVQFGLDKVYNESTRFLFIGVGSLATQAAVVEYSQFKSRGTAVGSLTVLSKAWDIGAGGKAMDAALIEHLAQQVHDKYGVDVHKQPRALAKLTAAATKAKEILTVNTDIPIYVEALTSTVDFSTTVSRELLERLIPGIAQRVAAVASKALAEAGMVVDDLAGVELLGGAVRVPAVQAALSEALAGQKLGTHLNGDEAMALGAGFVAANRSAAFRVRKVGMTDMGLWPVEAELSSLDDDWSRTTQLFSPGTHYGTTKSVSVRRCSDMRVTLRYTEDAELPAGTPRLLATYDVHGIAAACEQHSASPTPKVTLVIELDRDGVASLARAQAAFDETVEVKVKVTMTPTPTTGDDSDAVEQDEAADVDAEEAEEAGAAADEESTASPTPAPSVAPKTTEVLRNTTRKFRQMLNVSEPAEFAADANAAPSRTLQGEALTHAAAQLKALDDADEARRELERAKNSYEAFIYATRSRLADDDVEHVTLDDHRDELRAMLETAEDWLYEDGETADTATYRSKLQDLKDHVDPVLSRAKEHVARPKLLEDTRRWLTQTADKVQDWEMTKPQVCVYEGAALQICTAMRFSQTPRGPGCAKWCSYASRRAPRASLLRADVRSAMRIAMQRAAGNLA